MQSDDVLSKIVRSWPKLVLLGTVRCGAHERFASVDLMNALLVSIQIIPGRETLLPVAARYVAFVRFIMAKLVFAVLFQPSHSQSNLMSRPDILEFRPILESLFRITFFTNQIRDILGLVFCRGGLSLHRKAQGFLTGVNHVWHLFVRELHGIHG